MCSRLNHRFNALYFCARAYVLLCFKGKLFLSQPLGIEFRMLSTECSLSLGLGQIFSRRSGVLVFLPSRKVRQGKRLCTHRLLCIHPSRQPRWFHGCPVFSGDLRAPRHYDRCVLLQSAFSFENRGLLAKTFTVLIK